MAKKTYKTYTLKSLVVRVKDEDGIIHEVEFYGGVHFDSTARAVVSDPKVQELLERTHCFGRDFYIESVREDSTPVVAEAPKVEGAEEKSLPENFIDSRRFRNLVEMKDALKAAGLKIEDGWNYQQTKKYAYDKGYDYKVARAEN